MSTPKGPHRVWIPSGLLFNGCRWLSPLVQSDLGLRHITRVHAVPIVRTGGDRRLHGMYTNSTTFMHSFIQPLCETSCFFTPKCSFQNLSDNSELWDTHFMNISECLPPWVLQHSLCNGGVTNCWGYIRSNVITINEWNWKAVERNLSWQLRITIQTLRAVLPWSLRPLSLYCKIYLGILSWTNPYK